MELILISSNKLKVILNEEEMQKYRLNSEHAASHVSEKKHFNLLLEDIKRKSGFNTDDGSIYIEMFESASGGCEMFITREAHRLVPKRSESIKRVITESVLTYKFTCAENIILASKRLQDTSLSFESRLFSDEYGSFYLFLTFRQGFNSEDDKRLIFMSEYGERINGSAIRDYLGEHGKPICEMNAVEALAGI